MLELFGSNYHDTLNRMNYCRCLLILNIKALVVKQKSALVSIVIKMGMSKTNTISLSFIVKGCYIVPKVNNTTTSNIYPNHGNYHWPESKQDAQSGKIHVYVCVWPIPLIYLIFKQKTWKEKLVFSVLLTNKCEFWLFFKKSLNTIFKISTLKQEIARNTSSESSIGKAITDKDQYQMYVRLQIYSHK